VSSELEKGKKKKQGAESGLGKGEHYVSDCTKSGGEGTGILLSGGMLAKGKRGLSC